MCWDSKIFQTIQIQPRFLIFTVAFCVGTLGHTTADDGEACGGEGPLEEPVVEVPTRLVHFDCGEGGAIGFTGRTAVTTKTANKTVAVVAAKGERLAGMV